MKYTLAALTLLALLSCAGNPGTGDAAPTLRTHLASFQPAPEGFAFSGEEAGLWRYTAPRGGSLLLDPQRFQDYIPVDPKSLKIEVITVADPLSALSFGLTTQALGEDGVPRPIISSGMWKVDVFNSEGNPLALKSESSVVLEMPSTPGGDTLFYWEGEAWKDAGALDRVVYHGKADSGDFIRIQSLPGKSALKFQMVRTLENVRNVGLVGAFQGWNLAGARPFVRKSPRVYQLDMEVPPDFFSGYKFNVDGEWTEDLYAPEGMDDGFGGLNGLLDVQWLFTGKPNVKARNSASTQALTPDVTSALMTIRRLGTWINCDRYPSQPLYPKLMRTAALEDRDTLVIVNTRDFFLTSTTPAAAEKTGVALYEGGSFKLICLKSGGKFLVSQAVAASPDQKILMPVWKEISLPAGAGRNDWLALLKD